MTLALYMDEHVRRSITNGLKLRGIDVLTVQEDSRTGTPDPILLDRATELDRVMFAQETVNTPLSQLPHCKLSKLTQVRRFKS